MIRTEAEYKSAIERFRTDREVVDAQREQFAVAGLTPEQIEVAMQPLLSFQAQLTEEITWYENVCRGNFEPSKRLTDLGRMLIALRLSRGLTQKALAQQLGVSEAMVSRDERNEYHGITIARAAKILAALGFSVSTDFQAAPDSLTIKSSAAERDCYGYEDVVTQSGKGVGHSELAAV